MHVRKDVNLTLLFYLINIWLGDEIFDHFKTLVDIVLTESQLFRMVMITHHWRSQTKLMLERDQYSKLCLHFIIILHIYCHLETYTLEYQQILTIYATVLCRFKIYVRLTYLH